jgi:hypothetical protein
MNKIKIAGILLLLQACQGSYEYKATTVPDNRIVVDGDLVESDWQGSRVVKEFSNPWNKAVSPETSLRMVRDSINLYFFFEAADTTLVVEPTISDERGVEKEDRVELFFSKDPDMTEYYGFEMDAMGRVLSYQAQHYRKFNFSWDLPEGFTIAARIDSAGYKVEGAIPISFLKSLGKNGKCYFGAYRAEFSKRDTTLVEEWLAWKDPGTQYPDFHVPTSLGKLLWGMKR